MVTMTETIKADIKGTVSGQVAVGNYILQIGDVNGGVVNVVPPTAQPVIEPRARPVNMKPRPFPSMLDRVVETAGIKSAFETSAPVSIFGMGGMGKTSLLRRVAHLPEANNFSDGVVYLSAKDRGLDDLLQLLFDAFHASPPNTKPTDGQIRNGLQAIKAFVLLDDIALERDSIEMLLNVMPASMFVFASDDRSLWGEGQIVSLHGLPETEALMLFEKELGRSLSDPETVTVKEILSTLEDQPLRILHIASSARETGRSISEMREQLQGQDFDAAVAQFSLGMLSESQKKVLAVLGAAGGAVVPFQHVANLSEVNRPKQTLDSLMALGLVQAHSPRYSLTAVMVRTLPSLWNLSTWEDILIDYFSSWTEQQPTRGLIEDATDVLLAVMQKANDKKRWQDVIRLGHAIEQSLVFLKRWQAWSEILSMILAAAHSSGDRHTEAWVLHQLGSRALCMDLNDQAREMLTHALKLRQAIGDQAGLAITQHNMRLLSILSPPKTRKRGGPGRWLGIFIALVFAATLVGVGYAYSGTFVSLLMPTQTVKATYTSAPTRTFTPSQTSTITFTPSKTPTRTSTPTSSPTFTFTPTLTFTFTPSRTPTRIPTRTFTPTYTYIPNDITGPNIFNLIASPNPSHYFGSGCGSTVTTFSVTITNASELYDFTIGYSYDNNVWYSATVSAMGGDTYGANIDNDAEYYQAFNVLGGADGTITWFVTATDEFGNYAISADQLVSIKACPPG